MKVLLIFLIFLFSVIVCDPSQDSGYGIYPMHEPSMGYPIDQSNYVATVTQLLGISSLFTDGWPTSGVTTLGQTNQSTYLAHVCSQNSKMTQIVVNATSLALVTCNGPLSTISPRNLSVLIDGKGYNISIPTLYGRRGSLNGNSIEVASGLITDPMLCKGDIYYRVTIYLANSQYQCCSINGLDGQRAIYSLTIINGKCGSYCWLQSGFINLKPSINILGLVPIPTLPAPLRRNSHLK